MRIGESPSHIERCSGWLAGRQTVIHRNALTVAGAAPELHEKLRTGFPFHSRCLHREHLKLFSTLGVARLGCQAMQVY